MTNLNSILIDGDVMEDPWIVITAEGATQTRFTVRSRHHTTKDDTTIMVPVLTVGRLAEVCGEYLKKGRMVRVVGRLDSQGGPIDAPLLFVYAEHVEFKPTKAKED
jgi:single-strand DNA-binding protein